MPRQSRGNAGRNEMNSYDALAKRYDELTVDVLYQKRAEFLDRLLKKSRIPVKHVLDLGCGTGTMAYLLTERGYQVTAVDGSEEMLTQAMGKAMAEDRQPPLFLLQEMPRLQLLEPVDAAISTLDALNYLTRTRDLQETFRRVYRWLKPGGEFLFDVNTPYKLRRMNEQIYMDETEESFCVWRTFFSEKQKVCTYQVDLFSQRPDGAWDREFEEHRERAWEEAELRRFLEQAGFQKIRFSGDLRLSAPRENEDRWIVRAQKPAE